MYEQFISVFDYFLFIFLFASTVNENGCNFVFKINKKYMAVIQSSVTWLHRGSVRKPLRGEVQLEVTPY